MRARGLLARPPVPVGGRPRRRPSIAALVYLRGRDADGRLCELVAGRTALRPVLGALALALVDRRLYEELGYRCLGDWARERLGVGARAVREWARVWRRLRELPRLREAVLAGDVSWTVARRVVALVTPESEAACLASVRGRTVRAVDAMVAAAKTAASAGGGACAEEAREAEEEEGRVRVRISCSERVAGQWNAAVELARRMAGEQLPVWACAEVIAAEGASALGAGEEAERRRWLDIRGRSSGPHAAGQSESEHGLRQSVWRRLSWRSRRGAIPMEIAALVHQLEGRSPREVDRRLRVAVAFRQRIDFELGRILRQVVDRKLYRELGFETFSRYALERLDLRPRTARRLVRLARAEHGAPAVAAAFRAGRASAFQADVLLRVARPGTAAGWVGLAQRVTLRRLEEDVGALPRTAVAFHAPSEVAALFLDVLARAGSLEALLAHVIATWTEAGRRFRDHATFERDGYRCTVPGCRCRRNLHSHHIWFRSRGGPQRAPWNRTSLCPFHHHRGVHGGRLRIVGRAPDDLIYEFGGERYRSGDVRLT